MFVEDWAEKLEGEAKEVHHAIVKLVDKLYKKNEEIQENLDELNKEMAMKNEEEIEILLKLREITEDIEEILTERV